VNSVGQGLPTSGYNRYRHATTVKFSHGSRVAQVTGLKKQALKSPRLHLFDHKYS